VTGRGCIQHHEDGVCTDRWFIIVQLAGSLWSVADHSLPGLTRPYVLPCFVFEVRGCNWSTIRLRVAWSAALRLLR
jgi:hypothetical protein